MSYPCTKFQHGMTINKGINCIFPVFCFVYFWTNDKSLILMVYHLAKFRCDWFTNNEDRMGGGGGGRCET